MIKGDSAQAEIADISPAFIIALLHDRGLSLRSLARQHGYSPRTFSTALRISYPRVEELIAAALDSTPEKLWPIRVASRAARSRKRGESRQ